MSTRQHAKGTNVLVTKTVTDIEGQVYRFKGRNFHHDNSSLGGQAYIWFEMDDPDYGWQTFCIPLLPATPRNEKERRRMYRSAFAYIKGCLIAIDDGMIPPHKVFHAFLVDDDGKLMHEKARHLVPRRKTTAVITVECRFCGRVNRVPQHDKASRQAKCGHCGRPLESNFEERSQ